MPNGVREAAADQREHAPDNSEHADEITDLLVVQAEPRSAATGCCIRCNHAREQWSNNPSIKTDETETETEEKHGFPLVARIPSLWRTRHLHLPLLGPLSHGARLRIPTVVGVR